MSRWIVHAMTAAVLIVGAVLGAAGGASATPAVRQVLAASTTGRAAATQGGSCNAFSGAYQLPGSNGVVPAAYSDGSLVVPACGPIPGTGGGPNVYPYPGSLATPGYQCVEFSERYLYYKYGATMGISTNGDQVVAHYGAKYPSLFSVVANGTANQAPVQGDVLSFSTVSTFNSGSGGHTGVVQASSVNSAGNGSITIVEENAVSSGVQILSVTGWRVSYSGFPYIEWLHSGQPVTSAGDLLRSGSFEASFAGWSRYVPSGVTVNMVDYNTAAGAPAKAHDGTWYLAFNTNAAGGAVYQDVPVNAPAGTSFVGTAWLSAQSGTATGELCLWGLGASGTNNCIPYSVGAGSYKQVQVVYDAPQNIGTLRFQVYPTPGGGTTDMDTASLVQNSLRSGSFEASFAGWSRYVPSGVTVNMVDYNTAAGAPAKAHDGTWYLAFNTNAAGGAVYQDVPVNAPAGTSFVGTAWLSAQSGTATGELCLWGLGASGTNNCIPYSVGAGSYKQVQVVYDAPQNIGTLRFQVYPTPGGGTTDMDTASLVQNSLRSGSFEASFAGWSRYVPSGVTVNMVDYNTAAGAPAKAHDGTWYLAFNTNAAGGAVYQDVPVNAPAGTSFVGTAWLSAQSGTATGELCLWGLGASGTNNCIPYSVGAGSYKQVQVVYDAPQNIGTLRFQVYPTPGGGTTDMDTASLK